MFSFDFMMAKDFSCSLCVLYVGLGRSKFQFLIKKINKNFPAVNFFKFLVIQTLDPEMDPDPSMAPDPQFKKMPEPDPHWINAHPQH